MENLRMLADAMGRDLARTHKGDTLSALWPFSGGDLWHFLGTGFCNEFLEVMEELKKKYSYEEISVFLGNPSKIADYITYMNGWDAKKPKRLKLAKHFLELLKAFKKDPFSNTGLNPLKNFNQKILETKLLKKNVVETNKISFLLFMYLELIYPTAMRLGYEFHGPYEKKGKKIWVKEYYNLQNNHATETLNFPFKNITIIEEITNNPRVDFFNHLIEPPEKVASTIIIDGKPINNIKSVLEEVQTAFTNVSSKLEHFDRKDWLKFFTLGLFNTFQPLKDKLGRKFSVPEKTTQKINEEEFSLNLKKTIKKAKERSMEEIAESISKDYRIKVFGLDS
ncbi:hypothetical protein ACFL1H_05825 [Nanoarchaeota archaeon]